MRALHRFALLAAASTVLCAATAHAQTAQQQLEQFVATVKSARGEFVQQQVKSGGAPGRQQAGTFAFARPGRFVWHYKKPFEQQLIADGKKLWVWDRDLNQVTVRRLGDALSASPAAILFGSNDFGKYFSLKDGGERDGLAWLVLTPKAKDAAFSGVEIGFRDNLPVAMVLRDAFNNLTKLQLSHFEINPALAGNPFHFTPPAGADVIGE